MQLFVLQGQQKRKCIVNGSGSIDPIDSCARIAKEFGIHLHIDAAWGGELQLTFYVIAFYTLLTYRKNQINLLSISYELIFTFQLITHS